jgi:hypothetical protein
MRRMLAAAVAALTLGLFAPATSQALPLGQAKSLAPAIDRVSPIDQVRYCEYFDPDLGEYVVFWVPGSCMRVGSAGFYPWLGRYYTGGRYWRGRLGARPWTRGSAVYGRGYRGARSGARVGSPRMGRSGSPRMGVRSGSSRVSGRPGGSRMGSTGGRSGSVGRSGGMGRSGGTGRSGSSGRSGRGR